MGPPCSECGKRNTSPCGKWPFMDRYTYKCRDCREKFDYWGSDLIVAGCKRP